MIEERLLQCCVHVGTVADDQHQCVPFCAAQAWQPLAEMKPATVVGRPAIPLPLAVGGER
jgi:7,8-dihydro-6-hydroxymethylpterin dimethyltransferase